MASLSCGDSPCPSNVKFQTAASSTCENLYIEYFNAYVSNCTTATVINSSNAAQVQAEIDRNTCNDPKCFNSVSYLEQPFRTQCPPGTLLAIVSQNGNSRPIYSDNAFLNSLKSRTLSQQQSTSSQCYTLNGVNCYAEFERVANLVTQTARDVCTACIKGVFQRMVVEYTGPDGGLDEGFRSDAVKLNSLCGAGFVVLPAQASPSPVLIINFPTNPPSPSPSPVGSSSEGSTTQKSAGVKEVEIVTMNFLVVFFAMCFLFL